MITMEDAAFVAWLAEGGIENASRRTGAVSLRFGRGDVVRTWDAPDGDALAPWLDAVIRAASTEGPWWLWRRGGWAGARDAVAAAAQAAGIPRDFGGAARFAADEREGMMRIVRAFAAWPWGAADDLYVVPEDRSCVVNLCHDEEIHVHAAAPDRLKAFAAALSGGGGGA